MANETDDVHDESDYLHNLIGYTDSKLIIKELETGGSLADEEFWRKYPSSNIDPTTLELYFDSCISAKINRIEKEETTATFDYTPILPNSDDTNRIPSNKKEIGAVQIITQICDWHHLLKHPLISSFLYIKWHRMRWFFYTNLALVATFWLTLAACIILSDSKNAIFYLSKSILILAYILVLVRECLQIIALQRAYLSNMSNWFEIFMLVVCFFVIFLPPTELHKQLCAVSILSVVLELAMLVKGHPRSATYIIMLQQVTKTFFHFLLSYSILLVAFTLTFYKLFSKTNYVKDDDDLEVENVGFRSFIAEILATFFNVTLMMTGELNASSFVFETWIDGLIFILFVLFVPIILFNLLCGLAVCDVDMIRDKAEIMSYVEIVKYIAHTERYVATIINLVPQLAFLERELFLHPHYLNGRKISVLIYETVNKRVPIELRTIKRIKQLLFQNKNKSIIRDLEEISNNRETIRQLLSA